MNDVVSIVCKAIGEKKGKNLIVYDYTKLNPFIDYAIIASAGNQRQVFALAQNVVDRAKEVGIKVKSMEGNKDSRWLLVDLDTVVVHVFLDEERKVYKLEQLYADLPVVETHEDV